MRRQSREIALQILFQTEFAPQITLNQLTGVLDHQVEQNSMNYAHEIINAVAQNKSEIDQKIQEASRHWKIDRMASVDRNILRAAIAEMFYINEKLDPKIAINEAIELAKIYGTKDSGSFVNGLLDQVTKR